MQRRSRRFRSGRSPWRRHATRSWATVTSGSRPTPEPSATQPPAWMLARRPQRPRATPRAATGEASQRTSAAPRRRRWAVRTPAVRTARSGAGISALPSTTRHTAAAGRAARLASSRTPWPGAVRSRRRRRGTGETPRVQRCRLQGYPPRLQRGGARRMRDRHLGRPQELRRVWRRLHAPAARPRERDLRGGRLRLRQRRLRAWLRDLHERPEQRLRHAPPRPGTLRHVHDPLQRRAPGLLAEQRNPWLLHLYVRVRVRAQSLRRLVCRRGDMTRTIVGAVTRLARR